VNHETKMNFDRIGNGTMTGGREQTVAVEMVSDGCIITPSATSLDIKVGNGCMSLLT
jgi:hypothetical protein